MESRKENVQYNLLKTLLIDNPNSNSREIFELVKKINLLQNYLISKSLPVFEIDF